MSCGDEIEIKEVESVGKEIKEEREGGEVTTIEE